MKTNEVRRTGLIAALLLTVLVILGTGTVRVSAASTVATIGSKKYTSLEAAVKAVKNNQTIVLKKDVTYTSKLTFSRSKTYTLNLNKHTITFSEKGYLYLKKGTVTLRNGKITQTGETGYAIKTAKAATLNITSGTYRGLISNAGTMTVSKGTFTIPAAASINNAEYFLITNSGTLTLQAGTYKSKVYRMLSNTGTVSIKSGTFSMPISTSYSPIENAEGAKFSIYDGTFEADGVEGSMISNNGTLTIKDGSFTSYSEVIENAGTATIKGGTFEGGIYALIFNSGKMTISNGTFTYKGDTMIKCALSSSLTIKGGTFKTRYNFLQAENSTVKISGGSFKMSKEGTFLTANCAAKITVTGGTFVGTKGYTYSTSKEYNYSQDKVTTGKVYLKGGSFTTKAATAE